MDGSTERVFDVIVVGARCAGAPLATLLAREGLAVCLLDKADFPSDTPSTHIFEADALAFLEHLGVLGALRDTGSPLIARADARVGDVCWPVRWPRRPGDPGGVMSVRRPLLDQVLLDAAAGAGVDVRTGTPVTGLPAEGGRVTGVRTADGELRARLVVGADGRASTVARLAGARSYHVTPSQFSLCWGYFEGAEVGEPTFAFHRWADRAVLGCPTDSGLYQVQLALDPARLRAFRQGLPDSFLAYARDCAPVARALGDGARLIGTPSHVDRWEGYFREATGPGWALVGDAGHFKDPIAGRGIGDAFLQAKALAEAVAEPVRGPEAALDGALRRWAAWRDEEFLEAYWFAVSIGSLAPLPAVLPEVLREMTARGEGDQLFEMVNHRARPSDILTGPRMLRAVGRLLRRGRFGVLRETAALAREDRRRRALARDPVYVAPRRQQETARRETAA